MAGQWGWGGGGKKFKFFWKETQFFLDTLYMAGPSEGQGSQLPPDSANKTVNQPRDTHHQPTLPKLPEDKTETRPELTSSEEV